LNPQNILIISFLTLEVFKEIIQTFKKKSSI